MTKIYQGELPKNINVVVGGKVITTARFKDGIYETENKDVIAELKRYGYEVENKPVEIENKPVPNKKPVKPVKKKVK